MGIDERVGANAQRFGDPTEHVHVLEVIAYPTDHTLHGRGKHRVNRPGRHRQKKQPDWEFTF